MATRTTNYDLYKPDATDNFSDFREEFNDNMEIIDQNLGGGGGSGGHTIIDENGQTMTQRTGLEFTGNVQVADDSVNDKTIVDILGGGGNVYGVFIDTSRVVYSSFVFDSSAHTWTATEDCILTDNMLPPDTTTAYFIRIGGKQVFAGYSTVEDPFVYVKKGQVVEYRAKSGSTMKAYAIQQGTNGIFAPVIYSDEERCIGVWRDNKPLYQRTITYETPFNIANGSWYESSAIYSDMNIVNSDIVNSVFAHYTGAIVTIENSKLVIGNQTKNQPMNNIKYVTIQYTKTTDVAGSGNWNTDGVPTHHYSTNETVIGTWYNGKSIYEKTYEFPTALLVEYNSWSNTTIDSSNIQTVIDARAWHSDGTSYGTLMADPTRSSHTLLGLQTTRNNSQANVKVLTIQYTKTTD